MIASFEEAVRFLFPRTGDGGKKWSLGPTRALLDRLGDPQRHFPSIHIGGTNGKGSVASMIAAALRAAGHRVGLYTSPHLVSVRERIIVDDTPISEEAFTLWTSELEGAVRAADASFFEATTAMAFADFAARGVDLGVIEVGLGGRLDSTNVLDPLVSAVTGVTLEHTDYLGSSLEGIAREKAGIAKQFRPFIVGERDPDLAAVLVEAAQAVGAVVTCVPANEEYRGALGLKGAHQRRNAAVAAAVLQSLPDPWRPTGETIERGFARARLPGRLDIRGKWIFDVAHNPSGISALVAALRDLAPPRPVHALVGILGDKAWREMLKVLAPQVERLWVTDPPSAPRDRAWHLDEVGDAFPRAVVETDFLSALSAVQHDANTVVVTGSFHTVGDAMARLPGFQPLG